MIVSSNTRATVFLEYIIMYLRLSQAYIYCAGQDNFKNLIEMVAKK